MSSADSCCSECLVFSDEMKKINESDWLAGSKTKALYEAALKHLTHWKKDHNKDIKTYAFTFTTNKDTKLEVQKEMCEAAAKLFNQKTVPVLEGEVYLEYTEEGRPHLHGWYKTVSGGRIFAKIFKRCWAPWGEKGHLTKFPGGYHELMKNNRYIGYAQSEGRLVVRKTPEGYGEYIVESAEKYDA